MLASSTPSSTPSIFARYTTTQMTALVAIEDFRQALPGHLEAAGSSAGRTAMVLERMETIAAVVDIVKIEFQPGHGCGNTQSSAIWIQAHGTGPAPSVGKSGRESAHQSTYAQ